MIAIIRTAIIRAGFFLLAGLAAVAAQEQDNASPATAMPILRGEVLVTGDIVRIGDLVDNAGDRGGIAVFRAPDPGHTGSLTAARVAEALRAHKIASIDVRGLDEIAVTRASRVISIQEVEKSLVAALATRFGLHDADMRVTFDHAWPAIHADAHTPPAIHVARLTFDPRSGRFDAGIVIAGAAAKATSLRLTGTAAQTREVAVAARTIARGDILQADDIAIEHRAKTDMPSDAIQDRQGAIGLAVRQPINAGQVLRAGTLAKPELVRRNEPVIMTFEQPGLSLTLRGKALDSGAKGDIVNVVNLQSKRTLQGVVSGQNRVTITAMTPHNADDSQSGARRH